MLSFPSYNLMQLPHRVASSWYACSDPSSLWSWCGHQSMGFQHSYQNSTCTQEEDSCRQYRGWLWPHQLKQHPQLHSRLHRYPSSRAARLMSMRFHVIATPNRLLHEETSRIQAEPSSSFIQSAVSNRLLLCFEDKPQHHWFVLLPKTVSAASPIPSILLISPSKSGYVPVAFPGSWSWSACTPFHRGCTIFCGLEVEAAKSQTFAAPQIQLAAARVTAVLSRFGQPSGGQLQLQRDGIVV